MLFKSSVGAIGILMLALAVQSYRLDNALKDNVVQSTELAACGARMSNLLKDLESDNAVDRLTDDDLRDVPNHWLHPTND